MTKAQQLRQQQLTACDGLLKDYQRQSKGGRRSAVSKAALITTAAEPSYATLLSLDWIDSVWQMHNQLRQTQSTEVMGLTVAHRYLQLQYELNTKPRALVEINYKSKLDIGALERHLESLFNPCQVPLNLPDIQVLLQKRYQFEIDYERLLTYCNRFSHPDNVNATLNRFANPYRNRQNVYCSTEFMVNPQLGDKVVELIRRRSRRFGIVVDFKLYHGDGNYYPVIQTATHKCFVDPQSIIVVERLEPFESKPKRSKPHTAAYSLV